MAIDTSGLLTGLLTPSQRSQQRMGNDLGLARSGRMGQVNQLASSLTGSLSNLVGADTRSPEQRAGQQVAELLQAGDIDGAINILKDVDPQAAMTLIARQKAEQERLANIATQESEQERLLGAQTVFLSNAFPDKASILTPLLEAGVPLANLVEMGRGEQPTPLNRDEFARIIAEQNPQLSAEEVSRLAAQAWNARDEQPTDPDAPPRIVAPGNADLELAEQTLNGIPNARINAVIDNVGGLPWGAGVNELTEDDLKAELGLVIRNLEGRATPEQIANRMLEYYSGEGAVENGFQTSILGVGNTTTSQNGTTTDPNDPLADVIIRERP